MISAAELDRVAEASALGRPLTADELAVHRAIGVGTRIGPGLAQEAFGGTTQADVDRTLVALRGLERAGLLRRRR